MPTLIDYCPVAFGVEVVADRWSLLVVRELLSGATRFNDIHRGLPGLSRTLLSARLRQLEAHGVIERRPRDPSRGSTYHLTPAGQDLRGVVTALGEWAVRWTLPEPRPNQLDNALLLWRMRAGLRRDALPPSPVVVEFIFSSGTPRRGWLIVDQRDPSACVRDPGFPVDLCVTGGSREWHEIWIGRRDLSETVRDGVITIEGAPKLARQFTNWFRLNDFAPFVRSRTISGGESLTPS